jgi:Leucine-rich repeat (LRR) protein
MTQVIEKDSLALVAFYNALDGPNWNNNDNWLTGLVGAWEGISVNNGRVIKIEIQNNGLKGRIPEEINDLTGLAILRLSNNNELMGPLPEVDSLQILAVIDLRGSNLTGPFPLQITKALNLEVINLDNCGLLGEIPYDILNLKYLSSLSLSNNPFNTGFPDALLVLPGLKGLYLRDCQLRGPLPDLSSLVSLENLDVSDNEFGGPFPDWITNLSELLSLGLNFCGFTGTLPDSLFSNMNPELYSLGVVGNDLTGDVAAFMTSEMPLLQNLYLARNDFWGEIPEDAINMSRIARFDIRSNSISGLPDFSSLDHKVSSFHVAYNKLGFDQLESCLQIEGTRENVVSLGPQDELLDIDTLYPNIGDEILINSGSGGMFSQYQWYFNDQEIPGATERTYRINSMEGDDFGKYHCLISNDSFEFDLVRNDIYLLQTVNTTKYIDQDFIEVFPNPSSGIVHLQISEGIIVSIEVLAIAGQSLGVFKINSGQAELYLDGYPSGCFILNIKTDSGITHRIIYVE